MRPSIATRASSRTLPAATLCRRARSVAAPVTRKHTLYRAPSTHSTKLDCSVRPVGPTTACSGANPGRSPHTSIRKLTRASRNIGCVLRGKDRTTIPRQVVVGLKTSEQTSVFPLPCSWHTSDNGVSVFFRMILVLSQQLNLTYTGKQYYSQPGCTGTVTTVIWSETPGGCSKDSSCATNGYTVTCVTDTLNTLINYATHMMGSDGEIAQIKFWNDGTSKCAHFDSSKMYHHKVGACVAARDEDPSKDGSLSFRIQHASDALTMTNDRFSDSECMSPLFQDKITYDLTQRDCTEAIWGQFDSVDIFPVPTEGALASAVARKLLPSSAASASNYTSSQPSSTNSTPIIVGVVVGLIAIVAAIALGIYLHRRNQAHSASKQAPAAYAPVVPSPNAAAPSPPPSTFLPSEATPVFIQMPPQELARPAAYQAAPLPEKAPAALFYAQMNAPDPSIASSSSSTASLFDALQPPPAGAAAPPRREAEPLPVKNMAVYLAENTTSEDAAAKPASGVQVREEKKEKQALFNGLELPMTPSDWTVEQVKEWMTSMTDEEVAGKVVENDINGDTLFHLSSEDLESMGIKVIGQRVRLLKAIKELKAVEEVTSASATVYTEDLPPSYNFMSA